MSIWSKGGTKVLERTMAKVEAMLPEAQESSAPCETVQGPLLVVMVKPAVSSAPSVEG